MKISKKIIACFVVMTAVLGTAFSAQVIVSPRAESTVREYASVPSSVLEQLGRVDIEAEMDPEARALTDLKIAATDPGYLVTPGDVISVAFLEKTGARPMSMMLSVPVTGELKLSSIASFSTEGKTFQELKAEIEQALLNYSRYSDPRVELTGLGLFTVDVRGEVLSAKSVRVNGLSKLSDLMYLAGPNASTRCVTVTDREGNTEDYDMFRALRDADPSNDRILRPGDTVTFNEAGRTVVISGAVMRPGTYQLLEGENLRSLLDVYSRGTAPAAGNTLTIQRVGRDGIRETIELLPSEETELLNGDIIFIEPAVTSSASVSIEGALSGSATVKLGAQNQRYFYKFAVGETVYDMVLQMSNLFGQDSDIENAYLIRNGEKIMIDFADVLYGGSEQGRMALQAGDRFFVPFVQMQVSVLGAVRNPGIYGYVPGKTAEYYIKLAGGYTSLSKGEKGTSITDKEGNGLGMDAELTPETVIEVESDDTKADLSNTMAVVGLVTGIIGIVASIVTITTNIISATK